MAWVQGCPFRCPGCIAPDWIPSTAARLTTPAELAADLLSDPAVTGFTFSGGEPMLQATGLAETIRLARRERDLSLICFTGFRLERLRSRPPGPGVADLLGEIDILIDGPYVQALNDGLGMRGSSNQRVIGLTGRLAHELDRLAGGPRKAELRVGERELLLVGVPPRGLGQAVARAEHRDERGHVFETDKSAGAMRASNAGGAT